MAFEFKIQLLGITQPSVWRKLKVPENFTFEQFHYIIQTAFGWEDDHLYSFSEKSYRSPYYISMPSEYSESKDKNATIVKLKDIFHAEKQTFFYTYDFGDNWTHQITLEKITDEEISKPSCTGGKGKCPPEDCGGVWGYNQLLETINNPKHPEYIEMKEWLGLDEDEIWDPKEFNLKEINLELS